MSTRGANVIENTGGESASNNRDEGEVGALMDEAAYAEHTKE